MTSTKAEPVTAANTTATYTPEIFPPGRREAAPRLVQRRESHRKQSLHIRRTQHSHPRLRKSPSDLSLIPRIRHRRPPLQHRSLPPQALRMEASRRICNTSARRTGQTRPTPRQRSRRERPGRHSRGRQRDRRHHRAPPRSAHTDRPRDQRRPQAAHQSPTTPRQSPPPSRRLVLAAGRAGGLPGAGDAAAPAVWAGQDGCGGGDADFAGGAESGQG